MIAQFPPQLAIGQVIRSQRLAQREYRKQWYWAAKVGVSRRQWIRWESGQCIPSYDSILLLCQAFPELRVTFMSPHVTP